MDAGGASIACDPDRRNTEEPILPGAVVAGGLATAGGFYWMTLHPFELGVGAIFRL